MKTVLGVTGPTGAGKTTVLEVAADLNIKVVDCDKVARKVTMPDTDGLKALIKVFGDGIVKKDGTLDRKALAKAAFCDSGHTKLLNDTLLPHIVKEVKGMMNDDKIILDAPTLFESGLDSECTATLAVLSNKDLRFDRIKKRDGIDDGAAHLRMNAGKNDEFYLNKADYTVYNNGSIEETKDKIKEILIKLFERI